MKINLFIGFAGIVALLACKSEMPPLGSQWSKFEVRPDKEFPPLDSSKWSYPWYIIEHEDGSLENTAGDLMTNEDTFHLIHNAQCEIIENGERSGWPDSLLFCRAVLKKDTLEIDIYYEGADGSVELWIWEFEGNFKCQYESSSPVPNTEYSQTKFEKQKLMLNKGKFKRGEIVKGKIEVEWKHQYRNGKISNKSIAGTFETLIK